jgi:hypothetical protein
MPEFETYVDVDVDDFLSECSLREKEELIDALVEDGWVVRVSPKGVIPEERLPSIPELEWQEMCNKLSSIRHIISTEDEETIKQILKKF